MREVVHSDLSSTRTGPSLAEAQGLMELTFDAAQREKQPVCLMRIAIEGLERLAPMPEQRDAIVRGVFALLSGLPRGGDLLAARSGDGLLALFTNTPADAADLAARLVIEGAKKLQLPGTAQPLRTRLSIGLALSQPDLDLYFETLLKVSEEGVEVARQNGGQCCVHTQLYGLYQRKLEREKPRKSTHSGGAPTPVTVSSSAPASGMPVEPAADSTAAQGRPPAEGLDARLREALARERSRRAPLGTAGTDITDIEERLIALAHACALETLEKEREALERAHKDDVDVYERRIAKLQKALDETENELRELAHEKSIDPGVASAYRFVQGLPESEENYTLKMGLLSKIVDANLELKKGRDGGRQSA